MWWLYEHFCTHLSTQTQFYIIANLVNQQKAYFNWVFNLQVEHPTAWVQAEGFSKQVEYGSFQWARPSSGALSLISSKLQQSNVLLWLGHIYGYPGSLLCLIYSQFQFLISQHRMFPCLSQNPINILITEKSVLKKQQRLFMEWAFFAGGGVHENIQSKGLLFYNKCQKVSMSIHWTPGFTNESSALRPLTSWSHTNTHCMCTVNI